MPAGQAGDQEKSPYEVPPSSADLSSSPKQPGRGPPTYVLEGDLLCAKSTD